MTSLALLRNGLGPDHKLLQAIAITAGFRKLPFVVGLPGITYLDRLSNQLGQLPSCGLSWPVVACRGLGYILPSNCYLPYPLPIE